MSLMLENVSKTYTRNGLDVLALRQVSCSIERSNASSPQVGTLPLSHSFSPPSPWMATVHRYRAEPQHLKHFVTTLGKSINAHQLVTPSTG